MVSQVVLPRKGVAARPALAVGLVAEERVPFAGAELVDFALVTEQAAGVGEARELLTAGFFAFVGTFVLVHVFAGKFSLT